MHKWTIYKGKEEKHIRRETVSAFKQLLYVIILEIDGFVRFPAFVYICFLCLVGRADNRVIYFWKAYRSKIDLVKVNRSQNYALIPKADRTGGEKKNPKIKLLIQSPQKPNRIAKKRSVKTIKCQRKSFSDNVK